MIAHPEYQNLLRRACACRDLGLPWKGHVYRCPKFKFTGKGDVMSGKGSLLHGGRWNSAGQFPAIYASLTPQTALEESLESSRYYGLLGHTIFPRSMIAMKAKLHDILDLTDGSIRKHLLVSKDRLMDEDWRNVQDVGKEAIAQAVGRASHKVGFEGLLVPSKAGPAAANFVIFPHNLHSKSQITFVNEEELPE
ncbi:MAG: RES family NAD+ phosphorylase [Kiritimatiellales bacterium]|nr:RES family NAD+ phosphorylase [Kiritimatiellales bacterium]